MTEENVTQQDMQNDESELGKEIIEKFLSDNFDPKDFLSTISTYSTERYEQLKRSIYDELKSEIQNELGVDKETLESLKKVKQELLKQEDLPDDIFVDEEGNPLPDAAKQRVKDLFLSLKNIKQELEKEVENLKQTYKADYDNQANNRVLEFENSIYEFVVNLLEKKGVIDEAAKEFLFGGVGRMFLELPTNKQLYLRAIESHAKNEGKLAKKYEIELKKQIASFLDDPKISNYVVGFAKMKPAAGRVDNTAQLPSSTSSSPTARNESREDRIRRLIQEGKLKI